MVKATIKGLTSTVDIKTNEPNQIDLRPVIRFNEIALKYKTLRTKKYTIWALFLAIIYRTSICGNY